MIVCLLVFSNLKIVLPCLLIYFLLLLFGWWKGRGRSYLWLLHAPWLLSLAALNVFFIIVFQHRHWYDFSPHLFCLGFIKFLGYSSVLKIIVAIISLYIVLAQSFFSICIKWHTCLATWYCYTCQFFCLFSSACTSV